MSLAASPSKLYKMYKQGQLKTKYLHELFDAASDEDGVDEGDDLLEGDDVSEDELESDLGDRRAWAPAMRFRQQAPAFSIQQAPAVEYRRHLSQNSRRHLSQYGGRWLALTVEEEEAAALMPWGSSLWRVIRQ